MSGFHSGGTQWRTVVRFNGIAAVNAAPTTESVAAENAAVRLSGRSRSEVDRRQIRELESNCGEASSCSASAAV